MVELLADFTIFFEKIMESIIVFSNWLLNTILGEIMIFTIIIGIFFFILEKIIAYKDSR